MSSRHFLRDSIFKSGLLPHDKGNVLNVYKR